MGDLTVYHYHDNTGTTQEIKKETGDRGDTRRKGITKVLKKYLTGVGWVNNQGYETKTDKPGEEEEKKKRKKKKRRRR